MSYLDADPKKPKQELLNDIRAATQQPHFPGLPLLPFASLLVKVSDEASETIESLKLHITALNEKNGKLQFWVVVLAVVSLVGTIVQTTFSVAAYVAPPPNAQPVLSQSSAAPPSSTLRPTVSPGSAAAPPASEVSNAKAK